jgi:carboxymethylenebutenolidase
MGEWIEVAGTESGRAWLARPVSAQGPGVVVLHAWWGLNETIRAYADRLAGEGFVAIAPDLYAGRVVDTIEAAEGASGQVSAAAADRLLHAAVDRVRSDASELGRGIGVVAFSFGCPFAIDLAAEGNGVDAVVLHYGTGGEPDWSDARAAFLGHFAAQDPYEESRYVEALRRSIADAGAAGLAWDRTVAFLRENLGPLGA